MLAPSITFNISVHDARTMALIEALEHLLEEALCLRRGELEVLQRQQPRQIVFHVFEGQNKLAVCAVIDNHAISRSARMIIRDP
jgi:hypothetical protein